MAPMDGWDIRQFLATHDPSECAAMAAEIQAALSSDSNDGEHDALVSVAEFFGLDY